MKFFMRPRWSKLNIFGWKSDDAPGRRLMWPQAFTLLLMLVLGHYVQCWIVSGLLTIDAIWGVAVVTFFGLLALLFHVLDGHTSPRWTRDITFMIFGAFVMISLAIYYFVMPSDTLKQSLMGAGLLAIATYLVICNITTTWWPPFGRITRNIGERKD